MENLKDMEWESGQLDCKGKADETGQLFLPAVVLRKILENLSNADLLNLSLVNKEWNYEARSVLRDRGSLTAKMNTRDGKCKDLRAFASDLRRMKELRKVVPLSGLSIDILGAGDQHGDWCEESSTGELDPVYEDIIRHIQWKHLALHWSKNLVRKVKENCAGFILMRKILHKCSDTLEEFSLKMQSFGSFMPHFLQDYNFVRLNMFKFQDRFTCKGDLIKVLVSRAPNLKVLCSKGFVDLTVNLLEGRPAAAHLTDFPYRLRNCEIPTRIFDQLRLRQLCLTFTSCNQDLNAERFSWIVPKLLEKSRTTLSSLKLHARFLAPLMNYGMYLENIQKLTLYLSYSDVSEPHSSGFLESFDFNRTFPNLSSVEVRACSDYSDHERLWNSFISMVDQGNATLTEPDERCVNVKKLTLHWSLRIRNTWVSGDRFLVKMFPHIEKVVINADNASLVGFWDYWLDLEELHIRQINPSFVENLDSAFCGIFPEEVAELRERDDEYLQRVHIVPVMPSLSCLKRLKTFRLWFNNPISSVLPTTELSKVTRWIAFKRRRDLTVTLATSSDRLKRGLQHMEPFASVRLTHYAELPEI